MFITTGGEVIDTDMKFTIREDHPVNPDNPKQVNCMTGLTTQSNLITNCPFTKENLAKAIRHAKLFCGTDGLPLSPKNFKVHVHDSFRKDVNNVFDYFGFKKFDQEYPEPADPVFSIEIGSPTRRSDYWTLETGIYYPNHLSVIVCTSESTFTPLW